MEKLDLLFSVQILPQMAKATTTKINANPIFQHVEEKDKSCEKFNEPIFMVKTHDLTERLNSGALIAALFVLFATLTMMITIWRIEKIKEKVIRKSR